MTRHIRIRWLIFILLLEGLVFASLFDKEAVINAIKTPFNPLATQLQAVRQPLPLPREKPVNTPVSPQVITPTLIPSIPPADQFKMLTICTFEDLSSIKKWEEKIFKGTTDYKVTKEGGAGFLKSKSVDSCSGLYIKVDYPATPDLYVSWKWRAVTFPKKRTPANLSNKNEDDFAARIYVIFPGSNYFKSDVIEYIWDEQAPIGTTASSPYSERIKLVVLRSGLSTDGSPHWFAEERNVYDDYLKLYGREPKKPVGAIALMSDSDNTGTSSEADYMDIAIKIKQKA